MDEAAAEVMEFAHHLSWQDQFFQQQQTEEHVEKKETTAQSSLPPFSTALSELMLCVGDWPQPNPGSVALLESVLAREMTALVLRATDSRPVGARLPLDPVNLLWATRRDGLLTTRIMQFLDLRSVRATVMADCEDATLERPFAVALMARCRQFCDEIDAPKHSGEDQEAAARRQRLDRLTRAMNADQYKSFTSVRARASQRSKVCRLWIGSRWPEGAPPARLATYHVLLFVLKEMVALLVDACMLVRADGGQEPEGLPTESLTPTHVREALRRLKAAASPHADMLLVR